MLEVNGTNFENVSNAKVSIAKKKYSKKTLVFNLYTYNSLTALMYFLRWFFDKIFIPLSAQSVSRMQKRPASNY